MNDFFAELWDEVSGEPRQPCRTRHKAARAKGNVRRSSAPPCAARIGSAQLVANLGRTLLGWTGRREHHRGGPCHQGVERVPARSITAQHRPGRVRALRQCQRVWSLLPHWPQRIPLRSLGARYCRGRSPQGIRSRLPSQAPSRALRLRCRKSRSVAFSVRAIAASYALAASALRPRRRSRSARTAWNMR